MSHESKTTPEYGPRCIAIPGGAMTVAGPTLRIVVEEKEYRFERDYSGCPWLVNRRNDATRVPTERSPFWRGFYRWLREGAKLDGGLCVWTIAPKAKARLINRRHAEFVSIPDGWHEDDGVEYV